VVTNLRSARATPSAKVAAGSPIVWLWTRPAARGEQSECDADAHAGEGAAAVAFDCELVFAGPRTSTRSIGRTGPSEPLRTGLRSLRSGRRKRAPRLAHDLLELLADEAFVSEHGVAVKVDAFEHFSRDDSFGGVGRRELKAIGQSRQRRTADKAGNPRSSRNSGSALAPA